MKINRILELEVEIDYELGGVDVVPFDINDDLYVEINSINYNGMPVDLPNDKFAQLQEQLYELHRIELLSNKIAEEENSAVTKLEKDL